MSDISDQVLDTVATGSYHAPHDILGPHRRADGSWVIRARRPMASSVTAVADDGTEIPMPKPISGAAILNLRVDSYALIPMPLVGTINDAFTAFCGALRTATYLHQCYGAKPQPIEPPTIQKGEAA